MVGPFEEVGGMETTHGICLLMGNVFSRFDGHASQLVFYFQPSPSLGSSDGILCLEGKGGGGTEEDSLQ